MPQLHSHTQDQAPETAGVVIHWAMAYDVLFDHFLRPSQASIGRLAQVKPGDRVLDVGCGTGKLAIAAQEWAGPSGEAIGVDPSPEMIRRARRNAERANSTAKFQTGVAENLPFPANSFDVVLNRLMLHHLPGDLKQQGLAEMRRVLKPGGVCLIVDFEPPKTGLAHLFVVNHLNPAMAQVDVRNYMPLMLEAGFAELETGPTSSRLLSYVRGRVPTTAWDPDSMQSTEDAATRYA
jgi:ubiquinone/menaquinone biosynthesis C-methylase UbiE